MMFDEGPHLGSQRLIIHGMPYFECFISHYKSLWRLLNYISYKDWAILAFSANRRIKAPVGIT
jgi:hypothetical protein